MKIGIIILGIFILIIISYFLPDTPEPKCKICKDKKYHEMNIWYDEVITVKCEYCNNRFKKLTNKKDFKDSLLK